MKPFLLICAITLGACQPQTTEPEKPSPGAYMIVTSKNYEAKDLGPYAASLPPIYEKYGGYYVVFAPKYDIVEGRSDSQAIIISAWPDVQSAHKFWTSPEYTESKKLRDGIGEFNVVIVPAMPQN